MKRFVQADRNQPMLLPPDLREWVPEDDLAHFVIEAVERVDMSAFKVNERGCGSAQYHPRLMLALVIYCYANGIFSSRRIERATHRDVGVRLVAANTHPDHDTIATFRRENFEAIAACFLQVLLMAKELKLLKVGMVSVDGTKIDASASITKSVRYDRAKQLVEQLKLDIAELMQQAENADGSGEVDPQRLPQEIARREALRDKLDAACKTLEARAKARAEKEKADHETKLRERDKRKGRAKGKQPKAPDDKPKPDEQINLTDADSNIMRKSKRSEYRQAFNARPSSMPMAASSLSATPSANAPRTAMNLQLISQAFLMRSARHRRCWPTTVLPMAMTSRCWKSRASTCLWQRAPRGASGVTTSVPPKMTSRRKSPGPNGCKR
jgi:transposase